MLYLQQIYEIKGDNMSEHCYAVFFDNNTCKFGMTKNLQSRIASHQTNARAFSVSISGILVSEALEDAKKTEARVLSMARNRFLSVGNNGGEYFTGGDFHKYSDCIKSVVQQEDGAACFFGHELRSLNGELSLVSKIGALSNMKDVVVDINQELEMRIYKVILRNGSKGESPGRVKDKIRSYSLTLKQVRDVMEDMRERGKLAKMHSPYTGRGRPADRYVAR